MLEIDSGELDTFRSPKPEGNMAEDKQPESSNSEETDTEGFKMPSEIPWASIENPRGMTERTIIGFGPRSDDSAQSAAQAQNEQGYALAMTRKYAAAIPFFSEAVRLAPDNTHYLVNLGTACYEDFKIPAAIDALSRAVHLGHETAPVHYMLAVSYGVRTDVIAEIHHYRRALALDPTDTRARADLVLALATRAEPGDLEEARKEFKAVERADRTQAQRLRMYGQIQRLPEGKVR